MIIFFEKIPKKLILVITIILIVFIGILDKISGADFSFIIFYFLPIIIVTWYVNHKTGVAYSLICSFVTLYIEIHYANHDLFNFIIILNFVKRVVVFLFFTYIVDSLKKNLENNAKNKLIIQRNQDIILTSQRITGMIVKNISGYNTELLAWVDKQKANGKHVSSIVEETCYKVGANLRALSETSFLDVGSEKELDVEKFINKLKEKLKRH
jgi:hypothetical protein